MNFEERIDRLAERHEALAQSIELLTHDVHQLVEATTRTQETVANLALIARVHSQRLDRLEGQQ